LGDGSVVSMAHPGDLIDPLNADLHIHGSSVERGWVGDACSVRTAPQYMNGCLLASELNLVEQCGGLRCIPAGMVLVDLAVGVHDN
jgi:hypothetical protein